MKRPTAFLIAVAVLWVVAGCGSSDSESTSTAAASSSTTEPVRADAIEIVFDGTECSVSPVSVGAGDRAFLLTNTSDIEVRRGDVYVGNVPEGLTYQDVIDTHTAYGGPPNTVPTAEWEGEAGLAIEYEAASFVAPPDIELAENQTVLMARLTPGTDFIELFTGPTPTTDYRQWLCTPALEVTP